MWRELYLHSDVGLTNHQMSACWLMMFQAVAACTMMFLKTVAARVEVEVCMTYVYIVHVEAACRKVELEALAASSKVEKQPSAS